MATCRTRPGVWLKLNRMMTKIGNDRYRMNAPTYVGRIDAGPPALRAARGGFGLGGERSAGFGRDGAHPSVILSVPSTRA